MWKKWIFFVILFLIICYFYSQDLGFCFSAPCIGRLLGRILGSIGGAVIAVYPYLIIRRLFLKIGFPPKWELVGFILYTMVVISAISSVPR